MLRVCVRSPTVGHVTGQDSQSPRVHVLRPGEVARLLGIGRTTVHDAEAAGRLKATRTPGGHRRYPVDQPVIRAALAGRQAGQ